LPPPKHAVSRKQGHTPIVLRAFRQAKLWFNPDHAMPIRNAGSPAADRTPAGARLAADSAAIRKAVEEFLQHPGQGLARKSGARHRKN
jgi:hypothetical protein